MTLRNQTKNSGMNISDAREDAKHEVLLDGYFDGSCHRYLLRVQYEDTDVGGIVYHSQYLAFAERARSAWLRCLGINQSKILAVEKLGFIVRRIEVDFLSPARLDKILEVESFLLRLGGASLKLKQNIMNRENGHILARLVVDIGFVTLSNHMEPRVCRLSDGMKTRFSSLLTKTR